MRRLYIGFSTIAFFLAMVTAVAAATTIQDSPFQTFLKVESDAPTEGTCYPYEGNPDLRIQQVLDGGCLVVDSRLRGLGRTVFILPAGRSYVDGDSLENGVYAANGVYQYENTDGALLTVRKFKELPSPEAESILKRLREERRERRDREIRQEEERLAAEEQRKIEAAEEAAREARVREEARKKREAETARLKAESERRLAEEKRAAELAAADERRDAEIAAERQRIADEAKRGEEARQEAERKKEHEAELAKLRAERLAAEQARYKEHAEKVLSELKLDPLDYFAVQSSFKDKIGEPKVFTESWTALREAQVRGDWLEMLSLLGGRKRSDYPAPESTDSLIGQFLQKECRIQFQKSFVPAHAPHICRFFVARSPYSDELVSAQFRILSTHAFFGNYGNSLFEFKPSEAPFVICNSNASDFPNFNNIAERGPGYSEMEIAQRALRGELSLDDAKQESIRIATDAAEALQNWLESH